MKRLIKKSFQKLATWAQGPNEVIDPVKQHFIDNFGDEGLEAYKNINTDNVTYTEEGRLSLDSIKDLKGFSGENHQWTEYDGYRFFGKYTEKEWTNFLQDIKQNGIKEPIELVVTKNGEVRIMNGNHRLQAAIQLNLPDVPVVVKYRDGSEKNYKIN